jgi:hypothetical protein
MVLRRKYCRAILILLLAIGTAYSQTIPFAKSHSQNHASHCCGICHAGHLSVEQAVGQLGFVPLTQMCWYCPADQAARALEPGIVLSLARAPPA